MDKRQPRVSIVVPVYKSAAFLSACVDSLLAQGFTDYEILLIDDGSPDECPSLCDHYAAADSRVRAIHKENGGVSSARNLGIEQAVGEYIVFVDSDDYVCPSYLCDLLDAAKVKEIEGSTLILSDYQPFSESGPEARSFPQPFLARLSPGGMTAEQFRQLVFDFRVFPPYCKLYRRDLIEQYQIRFDTGLKSAEDFDFNCRYLKHIDRICYISSVQYHYRVAYKQYVPSNHGVLGDSEIRSAHIMANGITELAARMGLLDEVGPEINEWAAKKHYFNRLPMLFRESREVGIKERRRLFARLRDDPVYRRLFKRGIARMDRTTTSTIGRNFDCFWIWWLFFSLSRRKHRLPDS